MGGWTHTKLPPFGVENQSVTTPTPTSNSGDIGGQPLVIAGYPPNYPQTTVQLLVWGGRVVGGPPFPPSPPFT